MFDLARYWIAGVHNVGEPSQDEWNGCGSDWVPQAEGSEEDQAGFQGERHCQPVEQDEGAVIGREGNIWRAVAGGEAAGFQGRAGGQGQEGERW